MLLLFEQKMTYMQIIFGNFPKNLSPSTLWNEVVARRTLKIIENGQWLKKSGHPCYIRSG
jgi:hypothetical protein